MEIKSNRAIEGIGKRSNGEICHEPNHRDIMGEIRIGAAPATVFALLTDAQRMMTWLAQRVKADARPEGVFCLCDLNGLRVEGLYLKVVPQQRIVLSWGGIEGLKPGQSTVQFTLHSDGSGTLLHLRHFDLFDRAVDAHRLGWNSGLLKLKAVAEGGEPRGTYLGDAAELREHGSHVERVVR